VPKELRDLLGLRGGETLEIRESDGRIEFAPLPVEVTLEDRPGGPVAVTEEDMPPLSDDMVRETLERTRR
jgi:AbrB family looped-hinge helix DNA binding protein